MSLALVLTMYVFSALESVILTFDSHYSSFSLYLLCISYAYTIMIILIFRDKDGYHWLTGRVDDVINVRYSFKLLYYCSV